MQRILSSHHLRILIQFVFQQIESCNGKHQLFNLSRRLTFFLIILGSESKGGRSVAIRGYATFATRRSLAYDFFRFLKRPLFELGVDTGRILLHMPVDHNAPTAITEMPFGQEVLIPCAELF